MPLSEKMPKAAVELFEQFPDGVGRNVVEAAIQERIPENVKTKDELDEWAEAELDYAHKTFTWLGLGANLGGGAARITMTAPTFTPPRDIAGPEVTLDVSFTVREIRYVDLYVEVEHTITIPEEVCGSEGDIRDWIDDHLLGECWLDHFNHDYVVDEDTYDAEWADDGVVDGPTFDLDSISDEIDGIVEDYAEDEDEDY